MEATQYGHKRMMKVGIFCEMEGGEKEMEGERMLACMYIQVKVTFSLIVTPFSVDTTTCILPTLTFNHSTII